MPKEGPGSSGGGELSWSHTCDTCGAAACAVYCPAVSAYLCSTCDTRVHAANSLTSRHEPTRVCESCERAPAVFVCKADSASLCAACDAEVHSANPLASRHHRVHILFPSSPGHNGPPLFSTEETVDEEEEKEEDEEAASWLLMDQGNAGNFFDFVDYLDSGMDDRYEEVKSYGDNCAAPMKNRDGGEGYDQAQQNQQSLFLGLDFEPISKTIPDQSGLLSHSVSMSSMDVRIVPDSSSLSDVSVAHTRPPKGTIDLFSGLPAQVPVQLTGVEREARVMRYREKKKMRKFEKTVRYASRKAYAETRPRIKGRFAKRTEVDIEVDQMLSMADAGYGIVPSY
ncbi:hypothetical protein MLD38_001527 [Melastoma candidum]|uniref:Uncharacterized protein n=1 Tax=Melastoma candidum TaxID=119954 RepID=A0ACB9SGU3_9MYRT|nr:hypothetical protein MLD38_001527 [Melastoma candidum]